MILLQEFFTAVFLYTKTTHFHSTLIFDTESGYPNVYIVKGESLLRS